MAAKMDVSALVTQMHETLSTIHDTIAFLNATGHDERLDELERRRDSTIQSLIDAFSAESESLNQKRKLEREEIAERRRIEDEERERRRRAEDEELAARDRKLDEERDDKLQEETLDIEEETDTLMNQVEEEAEKVVEDGKLRLKALEEKRKACAFWMTSLEHSPLILA
ncbi:hypothetical protein B0T16DRAFT_461512 [Cercophora newfieldiana]|uniref:Uncharacterized protein n=1 Tax=Cercophora newfieldiana TaxID=92897 RepID=A0AA40CLJ4_9PEZI|nr:hypothetical protein B0T16DRAFT_461512 [Cercophora newfieldiana]